MSDNVVAGMMLAVIGGIFLIIGAVIGSRLALRGQREQRTEEIKGAIRAVTAELIMNATALSGVRQGMRDATWNLAWSQVGLFAHRAVDSELSRISLLLTADGLIVLLGAYLGLSGVDLRLERTALSFGSHRPPDPVVAELIALLTPAARRTEEAINVLGNLNQIWTDAERSWISGALKELSQFSQN